MCTINNTRGRPFGPDGCQVPVGAGICGETRTLEIINEFRRLYEEKMQQIENTGGGDCLQEKVKLQQEWIGDLTEQNEMLVRAVEELEQEATERVQILETKLHQSAQCICEVMKRYREHDVTSNLLAEPLQKIFYLESDQKNLLELLRRFREDKQLNLDGLKFYEVSYQDLVGSDKSEIVEPINRNFTEDFEEEKKVEEKECIIKELRGKIDYYNSFGNIECLAKELKCKNEECESLKQSMVDMRQALTEEVASKHDLILQLKRDCQQLEEKCLQADKQTAFKEDIIKELRKEIKQLKRQLTQEEVIKLNSTIDELQMDLQRTRTLQEEEEKSKNEEISKLNKIIDELKNCIKHIEEKFEKEAKVCKICKGRSKVGFLDSVEVQASLDEEQLEKQMESLQNRNEIIRVQNDTLSILQEELQTLKQQDSELRLERERKYHEIECLKTKIIELENALRNSEEKAANLQMAVDLYLNSINVLEASEEKYKIEIDQQKSTISNLQKALVATKQQLDEIKQKSDENVSLSWAARWFGSSDSKPPNNQKSVHDV